MDPPPLLEIGVEVSWMLFMYGGMHTNNRRLPDDRTIRPTPKGKWRWFRDQPWSAV